MNQKRQRRQARAIERLSKGLSETQLTEAMYATRRGEKPSNKKAQGQQAREQRRAMVVVRTENNMRKGQ